MNIVSMSPPGYPSAWLHPCRARFRFAWQSHCSLHFPVAGCRPAFFPLFARLLQLAISRRVDGARAEGVPLSRGLVLLLGRPAPARSALDPRALPRVRGAGDVELLRAAERRRAERRPSQRAPRLSVRALEPAASHSARRARSVRRSLLPSLMDSPAPALRLRPQALAVQPDDPLRAWSEGRFPGRLGRGLKYLLGARARY